MTKVSCSIPERFVNPLFEVFDGGDFILSSYRDIEKPLTEMRIYFEDAKDTEAVKKALKDALEIVGVESDLTVEDVPDDDWKFAYRRHFKTELVSPRIYTVPEWEAEEFFASGRAEAGQIAIVSDPGMAFGTGKHETTKACLQYIDEILARGARSEELGVRSEGSLNSIIPHSTLHAPRSFLDMGTGSGILSIAAAKLGCRKVTAFDVDEEAVEAAKENAAKNRVEIEVFRYGLGAKVRRELPVCDLVVANILGPLLIRFADEIAPTVGRNLVISGILDTLYPEVLAAYVAHGFREVSRKTIGEWTTGLLTR